MDSQVYELIHKCLSPEQNDRTTAEQILSGTFPPFKTKYKSILSELGHIAFPITLGASIIPLIMSIDTFIINSSHMQYD